MLAEVKVGNIVARDGKRYRVIGNCVVNDRVDVKSLAELLVELEADKAYDSKATSGVWLLLFLRPADAELLAVEGGELSTELHLTVGALDADTVDNNVVNSVIERVAGKLPPVRGKVDGIGQFTDKGDGVPVIALFDSPELADWRGKLLDALSAVGVELLGDHGYTPHITLAYTDKPMTQLPEVKGKEIILDTLSLMWKGDRRDFQLTGEDVKGGPGSGNFGHRGRPGSRGGSSPGGMTASMSRARLSKAEREDARHFIEDTYVRAWVENRKNDTPREREQAQYMLSRIGTSLNSIDGKYSNGTPLEEGIATEAYFRDRVPNLKDIRKEHKQSPFGVGEFLVFEREDGTQVNFGLSDNQHSGIVIGFVFSEPTGTGFGTDMMFAMRDWADVTGKPLSVYQVTNPAFFERFDFWTRADLRESQQAEYVPHVADREGQKKVDTWALLRELTEQGLDRFEVLKKLEEMSGIEMEVVGQKGGPGSGNFGHGGRPGKRGGSAPSSGAHIVRSGGARSPGTLSRRSDSGTLALLENGIANRDEESNLRRRLFPDAPEGASPRMKDEQVRAQVKSDISRKISEETGIDTTKVSGILRMWAETSKATPESVELQKAAAEEFGLPSQVLKPLVESSGEIPSVTRTEMRTVLRAMYDETQRQFRESGVENVLLFRGVKRPSDFEARIGDTLQYRGNPLQSWSGLWEVAQEFGSKRSAKQSGMVLVTQVPAWMVVSTARTGLGCLAEYEYVVLGDDLGNEASIIGLSSAGARTWESVGE